MEEFDLNAFLEEQDKLREKSEAPEESLTDFILRCLDEVDTVNIEAFVLEEGDILKDSLIEVKGKGGLDIYKAHFEEVDKQIEDNLYLGINTFFGLDDSDVIKDVYLFVKDIDGKKKYVLGVDIQSNGLNAFKMKEGSNNPIGQTGNASLDTIKILQNNFVLV